MGLYSVVSGEQYFVTASSRDEAEALYMVALGHMDSEDFPEFDITPDKISNVEYIETATVVEPILDLS